MAADYEIVLLVNSQVPEGETDETVARYQKIVTDHDAEVVNVDRWGVRKLAYEVGKQQQADYTFLQFRGDAGLVNELDRLCKLDEAVLRHMIVKPEGGFEEPVEEPEEEVEAVEAESPADGDVEASDADEEEEPEAEEEEEEEEDEE